ncbi:hypothetical protein M0R45_001735 [Rubus argutus]|uniref:Transposase n=1 Tax=Rubus argutus TaxID=59490 RepID=A0AAW1VFZ6_RUBAR
MWAHTRKCCTCPLYVSADPKQAKLNRDNVTGAPQYHSFSQKKIDEKCIEYIIKDELPFRHVEKEGFRGFCYEMQPRWKPMNRKQIAKGVYERFQFEKAKLLSQLRENETRISITTDTWTSIQNINYLVLTAHFMDSNWTLHKRIINFCTITSHKGDAIGRVVDQCLRSWEITKVFTITMDNASANDVAVTYMKRRLNTCKTLMFGGEFLHLRCACHIINLIVKDGIKELEDGIAAIWNCVKYIRSSSQRLDKFREFSVLENMRSNANVPLDVIIRWNSTYLMLEAALKYEQVFGRMADEDMQFRAYFEESGRIGPPSEENWRDAEAFTVFLKRFYDATVKLSAWKSVTANLVFAEMIGLQTEIDKHMQSADPVLKRVATSMKAKFDKYWGSFESVNKIIMIANVLDPRYKLQWATKALIQVNASAEVIQSISAKLKGILMRMYDEYKSKEGISNQENAESDIVLEGVDVEGLDEVTKACFRERLAERTESISNEVYQYLSDKYVNLLAKNFEVSAWWKLNQSAYPVLSKLAKDILAIPCSTVPSENAFSLGSRVVDPFKASLTPKMVEALVCSSDWLRADPPSFYDDPTEDELEMYTAMEELEKENASAQSLKRPPTNSTTNTSVQTSAAATN